MLAGERIVEVHRAPEPRASSYYTTQRLSGLEQGFVKIAREGQNAGAATVGGRIPRAESEARDETRTRDPFLTIRDRWATVSPPKGCD
jgi:hypothetical protein